MHVQMTKPRSGSRVGSLLTAGAVALAVLLTGVSAPEAQALVPGDFLFESFIGEGENFNSSTVAVDQITGDVLVTDPDNDRVMKFDRAGNKLLTIGDPDQQPPLLDDPWAVAVDAQENIYVVDSGHDLIRKFDKGGKLLKTWGGKGVDDGKFEYPRGIAVDKVGNVFVADALNNRIQKFSSDGTWMKTWGEYGVGDLQFDTPTRLTVTPNGKLAIIDSGNARVKLYSGEGAFLQAWDGSGANFEPLQGPRQVAADAAGRLYVVDASTSTVRTFSDSGVPLAEQHYPMSLSGIAVHEASRSIHLARLADDKMAYVIEVSRLATLPTITGGPRTSATVGKAYASTLTGAGVPAVSSFAITAGRLPYGLKLLAGGKIAGVPARAGAYSMVLQADNGVWGFPATTKLYTIRVGKASAKVSAKLSTKRPSAGVTRVKARIKVSAPYTTGLSKTGKVRVYYGKKRVKTITVKRANGTVTVRLPKFTKKGKTKVTLRYLGNTQLKSAKRTITVRVR